MASIKNSRIRIQLPKLEVLDASGLIPQTNHHDQQSNGFLTDSELGGKENKDLDNASNNLSRRHLHLDSCSKIPLSIRIISLERPCPISLVSMVSRRVSSKQL